MWAGLNGFDSRNDLVLGGVRIGMGGMNLVTAISRSTRVPVTLMTGWLAACLAEVYFFPRWVRHKSNRKRPISSPPPNVLVVQLRILGVGSDINIAANVRSNGGLASL